MVAHPTSLLPIISSGASTRSSYTTSHTDCASCASTSDMEQLYAEEWEAWIGEQGLLVLLPLVTRVYQSRIVPQRTELPEQAILYED